MPRNARGNESKANPWATSSVPPSTSRASNADWQLTFIINQEPLQLANVATAFTAITRLHTKLWLIAQQRNIDVVQYATTRDTRFTEEADLTAARITQNSPLTIVLTVSEALGRAVGSVIDAFAQTRQRYQLATLQVQRAEIENRAAATRVEAERLSLKADARMAAREAEFDLQRQALALKAQEIEIRDRMVTFQIEARQRAFNLAKMHVDNLYGTAPLEVKQMLAQSLVEEMLQLTTTTGLATASLKPRESA